MNDVAQFLIDADLQLCLPDSTIHALGKIMGRRIPAKGELVVFNDEEYMIKEIRTTYKQTSEPSDAIKRLAELVKEKVPSLNSYWVTITLFLT